MNRRKPQIVVKDYEIQKNQTSKEKSIGNSVEVNVGIALLKPIDLVVKQGYSTYREAI